MYTQIRSAQQTLNGVIYKTPIITCEELNDLYGVKVYLKCENLQRGGAFKYRGVFNAIKNLSSNQMERGIVTYSTGNHGVAVSMICGKINIPTNIIVPNNLSKEKERLIQSNGASLVYYDPRTDDRESIAERVAISENQTLIPPSNHLDIICGHATIALEMLQQCPLLDYVLVPCGGGGLLSGTAIAIKERFPKCKVIGIEPLAADDAKRSFETGELQTVTNPQTIADGTRTPSLGDITFPLILKHVDDMITVTEDEIVNSVYFLFKYTKMVVEPSGALGVAAIMAQSHSLQGNVGVILSGGNIDPLLMAEIIQRTSQP
ncbi:MAG: threonine/serine dehydratase [Anaerolineae bacterium]|nr:threonine/serine dehydratase [Anaerolineae bacterium]